ncbi:MAG: hypothetical protein GT600_11435 [Bacteroidales bacterium]|jgi:hypothetical protein|nr:hypothetical protein [Bacteroidales bacterium]NMD02344.1 hypothetical protein [Bacteroidales bacterium]OQB62538.1 MAG: hypothetical protein BWX96_01415 [Bacteroidetes bacterium ADurb.Bin145]HOU01246.1 hypothetical protein [Bacteroidales bacterium]HQK67151.1 hypothetical protein [Bacteroidales bacterium]
MEEEKKNSGQTLGIAALITAIITFVIAVIPCVGLIAIIPGIIAIVLASVGLSQASRSDSPRGVLIAGLVIGIVASVISLSQYLIAGKIADKWPRNIEKLVEEVQGNVVKELEDASVSIKVQNGDDKVEINVDKGKKDKEQTLEELEQGTTLPDDTVTGTK